uniref:BURP domain-containing protein n=1 Tax=Fagus sylvatica TaxID=28930 RepID=A0A2N9F075_FAGSY
MGDNSFQSYARNFNSGPVTFAFYGNSFNHGNATIKDCCPCPRYINANSSNSILDNGSSVNRWVESGKFFRKSMLKEGNVMVMPDIKDRIPKSMEHMLVNAVAECERAPSLGEAKRCVGSVEDMIDFAVLVLGHNVVVRSTKKVNGSKQNVMIGSVKGINGGEVTTLVSCHQMLYPYLLYYCHYVPKVKVYEVDILDMESKAKINHGVAICHLNTSAWDPKHAAFLALGSSPGQIEVCHWFHENEMAWTTAD